MSSPRRACSSWVVRLSLCGAVAISTFLLSIRAVANDQPDGFAPVAVGGIEGDAVSPRHGGVFTKAINRAFFVVAATWLVVSGVAEWVERKSRRGGPAWTGLDAMVVLNRTPRLFRNQRRSSRGVEARHDGGGAR